MSNLQFRNGQHCWAIPIQYWISTKEPQRVIIMEDVGQLYMAETIRCIDYDTGTEIYVPIDKLWKRRDRAFKALEYMRALDILHHEDNQDAK